jgi:ABC-type transport system involved in multi-copper enzyme maturation permease subunit
MPPALLLARAALLEARRTGLPWLLLGLLAGSLALAAFLSQVALTEGRELQAAVVAALLRAGAAFLLAAHVAASVVREANDKVLELALALPLSRQEYYLGKLLGYAAVGLVLALASAAPLLLWSAPAAVALWGGSLALELLLVVAATLFFAMTLANVVAGIAATAALYLLGRTIAAIQLLARGPLAEEGWTQVLARGAVDAVALLLPRLDAATRSDWLLYGLPPPGEYATGLLSLVAYAALLAAAGLFDFHRRNL